MSSIFWPELGILFALALVGGACILPYSMRLLPADKPLRFSLRTVLLLSFVQTAVLSAVTIGFGLLAAHAIGLGAPYIEGMLSGGGTQGIGTTFLVAALSGIIAGAFLLVADMFFLPYWPRPILDMTRKTTLWENFLASFYGGINEELLMRLFGFSVLAWLLSLVWHTVAGTPTLGALWTVNVVMAIIFGIGHLPALKGLVGSVSRIMLARTLLLNAPIGLLCGWLFWTYGIEAAIAAHFCADIVYHVLGTALLKKKLDALAS